MGGKYRENLQQILGAEKKYITYRVEYIPLIKG